MHVCVIYKTICNINFIIIVLYSGNKTTDKGIHQLKEIHMGSFTDLSFTSEISTNFLFRFFAENALKMCMLENCAYICIIASCQMPCTKVEKC